MSGCTRAQTVGPGLSGLGVFTGAQAVVEGDVGDAGVAEASLQPLVAVEARPDREGGEGGHLDERRPPLFVPQVEVVVVDIHLGPGEGEVRVAVRAAVASATQPGGHLLLGHTDQYDAFTPGCCCGLLVGAGDVLLALSVFESDDRREPVGGHELAQGVDEAFRLAPEHPGRGVVPPVQHPPHDLAFTVQVLGIGLDQ